MNLHQSYRAGVGLGLEQQFITNSSRLSQNEAETERKVVWGCRNNIQLVKVPPSPYVSKTFERWRLLSCILTCTTLRQSWRHKDKLSPQHTQIEDPAE